ncbi:TetR family transcriptional regulator [Nocardia sp. NPDC049220]|uniref:TetR/AcrR family transcriptional regulator n=1 Tax=Nocardia sp. NPDC049220 TaxID=3155273 RepID=UPI0033FDEE17
MRADAIRTRETLVRAAAQALAESGVDVTIAEIADRAGVAKGTVFRHFASKDELVSAIVADVIDDLAVFAEGLLGSGSPRQALLDFIAAGIALQARDRAFCQVAASAAGKDPTLRGKTVRLREIAELLAQRARASRDVRSDITGLDVVSLMTGIYQAALAAGDPDGWRRYLVLVFEGLSPSASTLARSPGDTAASAHSGG